MHDATTGARLKTVVLSATVLSGASVVDGVVYAGFDGGVVALGLP